jgi:hypothetical protein
MAVRAPEKPRLERPSPAPSRQPAPPRPRRGPWIAAGVVIAALLVWLVPQAERGIDVERLVNPGVPAQDLQWAGLSVGDFWVPIFYVTTFGLMALMLGIFYRHWRANRCIHPGLPLWIGMWFGLFIDPTFNWAMYAPYNPDLLHWPDTWSWANINPTVEPLWILFGAYQVFFLAPAMLAFALHRRFVARRAKEGSFTRRHPIASLFLFATACGLVIDIGMEIWMMNIGIYEYSQYALGAISWGNGHLPLWEWAWVGVLIGFYASLLSRDDKGFSVSARLAAGIAPLRRLRLGEFAVAAVICAVSLSVYLGFFVGLRLIGSEDKVAPRTWPYREAKTYDPQGLMEEHGQPGPYNSGLWCTPDCKAR